MMEDETIVVSRAIVRQNGYCRYLKHAVARSVLADSATYHRQLALTVDLMSGTQQGSAE